ncbi:unnamed protein product [Ceratitis capitata]|uniref:(Mediterranean fruit fly) hypothetical protein n=1 Tax=Ceratitis capitata TaxID=7213 RepID=A0A811V284_CERCA|nr:unnamed protein product [Ceratitis capitata]
MLLYLYLSVPITPKTSCSRAACGCVEVIINHLAYYKYDDVNVAAARRSLSSGCGGGDYFRKRAVSYGRKRLSESQANAGVLVECKKKMFKYKKNKKYETQLSHSPCLPTAHTCRSQLALSVACNIAACVTVTSVVAATATVTTSLND